jgi:hypothetical protein
MDSNLCRLRPDWCLHVPSRARTTGRSQLVPDLSRQDVRGKIYEHLHAMPALAHAESVKWNMSRRLSAACVQDWDARRQGEVRHVYALGAYRVFSRMTAASRLGCSCRVLVAAGASTPARSTFHRGCWRPTTRTRCPVCASSAARRSRTRRARWARVCRLRPTVRHCGARPSRPAPSSWCRTGWRPSAPTPSF